MNIKRVYEVDTLLTPGKVCQLKENGKVNDLPTNLGKALGIAQDNTGTVLLKGVSSVHTGLTPSSSYYYNYETGVISKTTSNGILIGKAISPTSILMTDYIIS